MSKREAIHPSQTGAELVSQSTIAQDKGWSDRSSDDVKWEVKAGMRAWGDALVGFVLVLMKCERRMEAVCWCHSTSGWVDGAVW